LLEHFIHALIEVLDVLVGVVRECVARAASPDQLLGLGIEEIDNYGAHLVRISRGRRLTKASATKAPKTPSSSKPVIKSIQRLLILGCASPNCMRAENSAIPCRDSCPVQAILYPRAPKISPEGTRAVYVFNRMEEYGRFRDTHSRQCDSVLEQKNQALVE
jgi:hypothetical protein